MAPATYIYIYIYIKCSVYISFLNYNVLGLNCLNTIVDVFVLWHLVHSNRLNGPSNLQR